MSIPLERAAIFDAWSPVTSRWSRWAMPTVFREIGRAQKVPLDVPDVPALDARTAWIVDLPGADAVRWGAGFARAGGAPVPLFNGTATPDDAVREVVPTQPIVDALYTLAPERPWRDDAPPAFLLDSGRCPSPHALFTGFDNRWLTAPHDFPSSELLRSAGISRVVVVVGTRGAHGRALARDAPFLVRALGRMSGAGEERFAVDLQDVLARFESGGLSLACVEVDHDVMGPLEPMHVDPPSRLVQWWRTQALERNAAGAFGRMTTSGG